jgi:hypothetical protein
MSEDSTASDDSTSAGPPLRIVSGSPTPEEIAVVTALVLGSGGGPDEPAPAPLRGRWADPAALHRRAWLNGAGGWRAAAR